MESAPGGETGGERSGWRVVRGKGKKSSETQRGQKGTEKGREGKEGERREEELNEGGREEGGGEGLTQSLQCISGGPMASNAGPLALGQALASTHECPHAVLSRGAHPDVAVCTHQISPH